MKHLLEHLERMSKKQLMVDCFDFSAFPNIDIKFFKFEAAYPNRFPTSPIEKRLLTRIQGLAEEGWSCPLLGEDGERTIVTLIGQTPRDLSKEVQDGGPAAVWVLAQHLISHTLINLTVSPEGYALSFILGRSQETLTTYELGAIKILEQLRDTNSHYLDNHGTIRFKGDKLADQVDALNNQTVPLPNTEFSKDYVKAKNDKFAARYGGIVPRTDTLIRIYCPDCKGTKLYQPLIGPSEPCKTCC